MNSIIYLFPTTYALWVFYLAVMNLARAKRERLSLQLWIILEKQHATRME